MNIIYPLLQIGTRSDETGNDSSRPNITVSGSLSQSLLGLIILMSVSYIDEIFSYTVVRNHQIEHFTYYFHVFTQPLSSLLKLNSCNFHSCILFKLYNKSFRGTMFALKRRIHWWMVLSCMGSTHLCFDRI